MRRQVAKIVKHPYFGARANFDFDYALIKIREPVTFPDYPLLRPVCLPDNEKSDSSLEGLAGTASGWGVVDPEQPSKQANELQRVLVKVMSTAECGILYQDTSKITDTMMCASGAAGKNPFTLGNLADACYGDSGARLLSVSRVEKCWRVLSVGAGAVANPNGPECMPRLVGFLTG